jgi:hypothetical protein
MAKKLRFSLRKTHSLRMFGKEEGSGDSYKIRSYIITYSLANTIRGDKSRGLKWAGSERV